jgi:hypothetical protein
MAADSDWISAGTEPRLAEILSDPATRSLMAADGVKDDDVNALIDRIRCSVSPMQFVPEKKAASGMTAKVARPAPTRSNDHKLSMLAASGVVSRWIASISGERITAD